MPTARPAGVSPLTGATPLFAAPALRAADQQATHDYGIPGLVLMERAGVEASRHILRRYPDTREAVVLVGPGNNGGDGYVVARHLQGEGWNVRVIARDGTPPGAGDGAHMAQIAGRCGLVPEVFDPRSTPPDTGIVIDAMLGIGQDSPVHGTLAEMVAWVASGTAPVVALDVPTGVYSDSGRVGGPAVRADLTVTFHGDTVGLHVAPGRFHSGEVIVADIGIPAQVRTTEAAWLFGENAVAGITPVDPGIDKYAAGAVLVIAGSAGMPGAVRLASLGALRSGAGLVVAATPTVAAPAVLSGHPEVIVQSLDAHGEYLVTDDLTKITDQAQRCCCVVIGPGIGRHPETGQAVSRLLATLERPMILDADGLWHLGTDLDPVANRPNYTVITPHTGEAARLLGIDRTEVEANRLAAAQTLAERAECCVVLKGPGTIVAHPNVPAMVCAVGGPELATAGSGDVLCGVIAAAMATGAPVHQAAAIGVALHARAGRLAGRGAGTLAGDIAEACASARDEGAHV